MSQNTRNRLRLMRSCSLMLAFFALVATMIVAPAFNINTKRAYAATNQDNVELSTSYTLKTSVPSLSTQNCSSSTSNTTTTYSCSFTLLITPSPKGNTTISVSVNPEPGIFVSPRSITFTSTYYSTPVTISSLPCSNSIPQFAFSGSTNKGILVTSATLYWNCTPTPTPDPTTPTMVPKPDPSTAPTPDPTTQPTSGTAPTATPHTNTSTPAPTATPKEHHSIPPTPSPTSTPTPVVANAGDGGSNQPPTSTNNGSLFLLAGLVLVALALLLYLFSWGQASIGERMLSLVLPKAMLRRTRRQ